MHAKLHKNLFISTCSLHWNIKSSWEVCENPVLWWKTLIYWMDICCRCTLELPLWGNSNVYQQHMLLKLRKPILKYTLNKYHVHWLSSFKHLKLPISIKIPETIWQIVYIYMTAISPNMISWTMLLFCLFDLILYVHSTIFQLCGTGLPGLNQY